MLIRVQAVGLNFRDVLNVLGMYPGDPGNPGADVAGIVEAVSPEAAHLHQCAAPSSVLCNSCEEGPLQAPRAFVAKFCALWK